MLDANSKTSILEAAKMGRRIVHVDSAGRKIKQLWGGLGNRSGLHEFADRLTDKSWQRGGGRLAEQLDSIGCGVVQVLRFVNVTRDRGHWVVAQQHQA